MAQNFLSSQVRRVAFGGALIVLAFAVKALDEPARVLAKNVCDAVPNGVKCVLGRFAFETIGMDAVWTLLLLIGAFYLIIFDWAAGALAELFNGILAAATNIRELVTRQMSANRLQRDELRDIFATALAHVADQDEWYGGDFAGFVFDGISRRPEATWRRNSKISIVVEDLPAGDPLAATYQSFHENKSFEIISEAGKGCYIHAVDAQIEAAASDLDVIVQKFNFWARLDGTRYDFAACRAGFDLAALKRRVSTTSGAFTLGFDGSVLRLSAALEFPIKGRESTVVSDEKSLMLKTDREYVAILTEPSRGFHLTIKVPQGSAIMLCCASMDRFSWHAGSSTGPAVEFSGRDAQVSGSWWALPGIAAIVTWR